MILNCLCVGAGGFIGAVARYLVGLLPFLHRGALPWPTLLVNVAAALIIGAVVGYAEDFGMNPRAVLFLKTGVCGGFSTLSALAVEDMGFMQSGHTGFAVFYTTLTIVLCMAAVFFGRSLAGSLR